MICLISFRAEYLREKNHSLCGALARMSVQDRGISSNGLLYRAPLKDAHINGGHAG